MKLKMTIPSSTTTSYVSAKELKKKSDGISDKGYFFGEVEWNDSDDPIVVTVKCTTYINETLTGTEKKDVVAHERQHFTDFIALAVQMKKDIEGALKGGKDPQISDRVDWLYYDKCVKSAAFHRETAGYSVEICFKPSSDRPK
jgi:hypothetical protein